MWGIRMDIEEDINILNNLKRYLELLDSQGIRKIFYNDLDWDEKTIDCINAIEHILAEREEDKKRIEELEKENKRKDMFVKMAKEVIEESILKQKIKEELEKAKKENEPYEIHNKESRMFWINQGKIRLAKKLLEDK